MKVKHMVLGPILTEKIGNSETTQFWGIFSDVPLTGAHNFRLDSHMNNLEFQNIFPNRIM